MSARPSRAQSAYSAANLQRQRSVVADARRAELAIVSEADECFGHIMSDHRDGSLSDATIRRRLESFALSVRDVIEKALVLGSRTWWNASVDVWARAAEQDPALMRAIAFSPRASGTLRESASEYRAAAFALLEIMSPPSVLEVLSIVNAPVNGQTWRERLSVMTSLRVSQREMAGAIAKAYAAGGNISEVQRAIRPLVQKSASAARTIARTESLRVANTMRERASEAAGDAVVGYTRRATLDDVTRPEHARQNGRVFKKGEPRPSMPDGPNCRCWYDDILATDVKVFGRPGSLPPEARHVEAFARWFDGETPARKVAAVGREAFDRAAAKFKTTNPSWEQIGGATPDIESQRIRGELDQKIAAAKARRSA